MMRLFIGAAFESDEEAQGWELHRPASWKRRARDACSQARRWGQEGSQVCDGQGGETVGGWTV